MADLVNIFSCLPGNNGPLLRAVGQHHNVSRCFWCACWRFFGSFCNRYRWDRRALLRIIHFLFSLYVTSPELGYCTSYFHLDNRLLRCGRARGNRTTQWQHERKRAVENKPTRQRGILKSYQGVDKLIGMSSEIAEPHRSAAEDEAAFGFTLSMIFAARLLLFIYDVSACMMMCSAAEE